MDHLMELDDIQSRLKLDYQVVTMMRSPLMVVEGYRNVDDVKARRDTIMSEAEGHLATHYRVDYYIKTLIERGRYSNKTSVDFDLFANNNYPFVEPSCFVVDSEMPWSPHFWRGHPICIGPIWEHAEGNMLLGQLLVHIAKLLNFDEPAREPGYEGYNGEAIEYWETVLGRQPITKNLRYPVLPDLVLEPSVTAGKHQSKSFVRKKVTGSPANLIRIRRGAPTEVEPAQIKIRIR